MLLVVIGLVLAALGAGFAWWVATAPKKPDALKAIDAARKKAQADPSTGKQADGGSGQIQVKNVKKNIKFVGEVTAEEVKKHNTRADCWIIVDGKVYDVTTYIDLHPGGDAIMNNAGLDSSEGFHGPQHTKTVENIIPDYFIGTLVANKKTN